MRLGMWVVVALAAACSESVAVDNPSGSAPTPSDPAGGDDDDAAPPQNQAPVADAGVDFGAMMTDEVELDGSSSYDPDGDAIEFEWELVAVPAGSTATLLNASRPNPSFFADRPGTYAAELAVNDGLVVATDQVLVTVTTPNDGPVANAGPDQSVDAGDRVVLNGSGSYDPDNDPLDFRWTLTSTPAGSAAFLDDPTSALPQFTADLAGVYVVELEVDDGTDLSPADQVLVTASEATDSGCISCATASREVHRRIAAGDVASAGLLSLLPIGLLLWHRRRGG